MDSGNASEANANGFATTAPPPAEEPEAEAEEPEAEPEEPGKLAEPLELREGEKEILAFDF